MMKVIGTAAKNLIKNDSNCFGSTISANTNYILGEQHKMIHLLVHLIKLLSGFNLNCSYVTK